MTYPPPMGATDHYAPATSLMEAWLQGSPTSLKAQEVALQAIAAQLRSIQADYQKTNEHIKAAYPAGAGAFAVVETGLQITQGMDHATGTLSGKDKSLSQIIGEAATNLASTQNSTSTIKTVFDAVVQALESSVWTEWAAPGVAYVGTFAQIVPAAVQLMEMYNTVSTFVDNIDPDESSSQLATSDAGQVGQGYQAGTMPVGYQPTGPYDPSGYGQNGYGQSGYGQNGTSAPWQDATGQWHYPSATTPWQDATGQWHAPTGSAGATGNGSGYGAGYGSSSQLPGGQGYASNMGSTGTGSSGMGSSGMGSSGMGSSGMGSSGGGAPGPVSVPDLASGWQPVDAAGGDQGAGSGSGSTGSGSTGSGSTGSGSGADGSGAGDHGSSGTGSGDHGSGSTDHGTGGHATGDTTGADSDSDGGSGSGVTITVTEGDSSMTVTTDQDGHFVGTLHGHEVDIDVDLVEARTAASAQGA